MRSRLRPKSLVTDGNPRAEVSFFIYFFERQSYRRRERSSIPWFTPHMAGPWPMPGARSFLQAAQVGAGAQALWPSSTAFPGALAASWSGSGAGGTRTSGHVDACPAGWILAAPQRQPPDLSSNPTAYSNETLSYYKICLRSVVHSPNSRIS